MTFLFRARLIGPLAVLTSALLCGPSFADPPPKIDEKRLGYIQVVLEAWESKFEWAN
jgi:hypothetical protein